MARLHEYNFDLCIEICERISNGENIKSILASDDRYPVFQTWCNWKRRNKELLDLYTQSKQDKSEIVDSKIDEVMDDLRNGVIDPPTARVLIDTLKWKAGKYYPKMFGDKIDVTSGGEEIKQTPTINIITPKE